MKDLKPQMTQMEGNRRTKPIGSPMEFGVL